MPSAGTTEHLREQHQRPAIEPIAMRVPDACRYVGIGRSTLYILIGQGEVEIIKLGSSTLVLTASLRRLVEQRRQGGREQDGTAVLAAAGQPLDSEAGILEPICGKRELT